MPDAKSRQAEKSRDELEEEADEKLLEVLVMLAARSGPTAEELRWSAAAGEPGSAAAMATEAAEYAEEEEEEGEEEE